MKRGVDDPGPGESVALSRSELLCVFLELRPRIERIVASRLDCSAAAADVVQDLYLRLDRIDRRLGTQDEARRYLVKMALNAAIDLRRVETRRVELLDAAVELFDVPTPSPEDTVLAADQLRSVDAALAELPDKCREMLFLSRVEGLTQGEIAERLGVSRSLVEKYLVKALLHCRARLSAEG